MPGITGHERPHEGATNVWLTPRSLVEALGVFDLDPCAADPRPFDLATKNYTEAMDGLSLPWEGRVWMNPPYGPHVGKWLDRLIAHGNGIALVFARTETIAMQEALRECDAVFFPDRRITFLEGPPPHNPGRGSSGAPSMLLAFGQNNVDALEGLADGVLFTPVRMT